MFALKSRPRELARPAQSDDKPITLRQVTMLILCIYVLAALFIDTVFDLPSEVSVLLNQVDNIVCIFFIWDFVLNVMTAQSKLGYLKWGWIDLVSSIPNIQILRWGRFAQVIRILRILRAARSIKLIIRFLFANRAKGTFASVSMISFFIVVFSSIAILNCEISPESNIKTASDALWWSFVTITTVGYGDFYPTTSIGRMIASALIMAGVGLFGTFTAYVASFFMQYEESADDQVLVELEVIKEQLKALESKIALDNSGKSSEGGD